MDDFRKEILKVNKSRVHKVHNSLGVYDGYKWLRKNKWLDIGYISEHDYYAIIRTTNKALINNFFKTGSIKFPERMGELLLRKFPARIILDKGKMKTNLPVDWDATLNLWAEDKEAYSNKTLIRAEEKELFKVLYDKSKALYNNKSFYEFDINREVKLSLKSLIKKGQIDAFILYKES